MSDAIERLHEAIFGFVPRKAGTAYERIVALVFAALGWSAEHDRLERLEGKLAAHQIDVIAQRPGQDPQRLILECKDFEKLVGKGTLDTFVGVLKQLEADAGAVVTTKGFKKGARDVAADEDVAMVLIRPYAPTDEGRFIRAVHMTMNLLSPSFSDWDFDIPKDHGRPPGTHVEIELSGASHLLHLDGSPAETIDEVVRAHPGPMREGIYQQRVDFPGRRLLPVRGGTIPIAAIRWTETVTLSQMTHVVTAKGHPVLVVEQLDRDGKVVPGSRLVADRDLYAWDIDGNGVVVQRGALLPKA